MTQQEAVKEIARLLKLPDPVIVYDEGATPQFLWRYKGTYMFTDVNLTLISPAVALCDVARELLLGFTDKEIRLFYGRLAYATLRTHSGEPV